MAEYLKKSGFTLIELIVYVGIIAFVLVAITTFAWNIMGAQTQINASSEIVQNGRIILEQLTKNIRTSNDFVLSENKLELTQNEKTIIFKSEEKTVTVGGEQAKTNKLIMEKDGQSFELSSDKINISQFKITDLSHDENNQNLKLEIVLNYLNPGEDPNRNKTITLNTAVSLRP